MKSLTWQRVSCGSDPLFSSWYICIACMFTRLKSRDETETLYLQDRDETRRSKNVSRPSQDRDVQDWDYIPVSCRPQRGWSEWMNSKWQGNIASAKSSGGGALRPQPPFPRKASQSTFSLYTLHSNLQLTSYSAVNWICTLSEPLCWSFSSILHV